VDDILSIKSGDEDRYAGECKCGVA